MAASSSGVRKISKGPQVFINFLGKELRKGFIAHLEVALEEAKINFFIDKHERVGTKLQNLLVRIEQSRVVLTIFSKEYTTSVWCLDELVKIKECMDKGSLIGIPIFYKLEISVVRNLEGDFGDNFRELKRKNQHDLVKTQKWEEALTSTPEIVGMHLSENSNLSDREFIESIVKKVKSLLDDISLEEKPDQKRHEVNSQCSIHMMKANLDALHKTLEELEDGRDDLLGRVAIEEDKGLQRLAQVKRWLERVESVRSQVNDMLEARSTETERLCLFGYCSDNCYDYGEEVLKRLEEVKELISKGVFDVVAQKIHVPKVEMKYIQTTVGLDTKVEMAWKSLMNDERRILGLYGMGGVGKTALLTRINNKFIEVKNEFDVVIWVVVSKDKLCFLYCSLFPEDFEIEKVKLIEYWICEGFINANRYEDGGTNKGYDIIGLLVRAHLLIDCELKIPAHQGYNGVKMHDVIREMALWIESGFGNKQETICVKSGAHVRLIPDNINWEIVRRISLMKTEIKEISCSPKCPNLSTLLLPSTWIQKIYTWIKKISCSPKCPNLSTLLLPNNELVDISVGFFRFMPQLVVLDLSGNRSLIGLPEEISNLGSLKYLNLSSTEIRSLPVGLKKLRKLIYLNLEFTYLHESLVGISTTLSNLQVLKLLHSGVFVDDILLEELQRLEHLKVLTANIEDAMILERIQGVDRLARSIRGLCLQNMSAPLVILNTVALGGLQRLEMWSCNISEIKIDWKSKERRELSPVEILPSTTSPGFNHLSDVIIGGLKGQKDLSWLLFAQNLRELYVGASSEIEEIINKEKGMSIITKVHQDIVVPFENLESLTLYRLDGLTEICWNYPNLPNCKKFHVIDCPKVPEDIANFGRHTEE